MSSITINSNLASLGTQRRLGNTTAELSRSYERLSSGLRINRASDDAAGLAIASGLSADAQVFNQGIRNLNDGLSLLNVADGALTELSNIVIRIRELAEQSANGTLSNTQREAIDQEAQELSDEFTRIAQTTEVNGLKLFDGSLGEVGLQAGYGERGAVTSTLGGAIGDGTFSSSTSFDAGQGVFSVAEGDFDNDGNLDLVTADYGDETVSVLLGRGDGTFSQSTAYSVGVDPRSVKTADFNGDNILDIASANYDDDNITILLGRGDGTFSQGVSYDSGNGSRSQAIGDYNSDGILDIATVNTQGGSTISILQGNGDGTFSQPQSFTTGDFAYSVRAGDFDGDGILDLVSSSRTFDSVSVFLGQGDGTFSAIESYSVGSAPWSVTVGDFNGDDVLDIASANSFDDSLSVLLNRGDGTFFESVSYAVGDLPRSISSGDVNGDGNLDLFATDSNDFTISVLIANGDGTFQQAVSYETGRVPENLTGGDFNNDGVFDIVSADKFGNTASILLGNSTAGVGPLLSFSLATQSDALQAMAPLDRKIEQLAVQKGRIGAFQSRIEVAANTLQVTSTNVRAAESRIADVDTAFEAAQLARLNILQQAGAAVLAQANVQPQLALRLLET